MARCVPLDRKMEDTPAPNQKPAPPPPGGSELPPLPPPCPRRRFRPSYLIAIVAVLLLAGATVFYYLHYVAPYESTDDAFVDGYVTFVSPRVSGQVLKLLVADNQRVKAGEVLVEIDPNDYETQVAQTRADLAAAKARLEQAKAQVAVDQAKLEEQEAVLIAAEAEAARAAADQIGRAHV